MTKTTAKRVWEGNRQLNRMLVPIDSLAPHPDNPRRHDLAAIKESLERFGQQRPIIVVPPGRVDVDRATIIAGHGTTAAAAELGWTHIARLADLRARDRQRGLTDPDDVPDAPEEPQSQVGEVYELGQHLLMCGDATNKANVEMLFSPPAHHALDLVDAIWTDPPYGVGYVGKTADALTFVNDEAAGVRDLVAAALRCIEPGLAPHARFYVAAPPGPRHEDFLGALNDVGWRLHQTLVWVKQRGVLGHSDYHYQHEPILYGWATHTEWKGRPGRGRHRGSVWYGGHDQTTVFQVDAPTASREHPTMKPVALVEIMLSNSTQRGSIVYDPFAGSGPTLIACESLGRRCRAMEVDPRYCDVIRTRYVNFVDFPSPTAGSVPSLPSVLRG